ncbi:MAG: 3TM-type holin, partial [Candidatus Shapirobacteria bacterium]
MFGLDDAISNTIVGTIGKVLDRVLPDDKAKAAAALELAKLQQDGELQELTIRMSAIVEEAKSQDPWTSRARPSFLYVFYALILFSIPMGILTIFSPSSATTLITGFKAWLD